MPELTADALAAASPEALMETPALAVRRLGEVLAAPPDEGTWRRVWANVLLRPLAVPWRWARLCCGPGGTPEAARACADEVSGLLRARDNVEALAGPAAACLFEGMIHSVRSAAGQRCGEDPLPDEADCRRAYRAAYSCLGDEAGDVAARLAIHRLAGPRRPSGRRGGRFVLPTPSGERGSARLWAAPIPEGCGAGPPAVIPDPPSQGMIVFVDECLREVSATARALWSRSEREGSPAPRVAWGLAGIEGRASIQGLPNAARLRLWRYAGQACGVLSLTEPGVPFHISGLDRQPVGHQIPWWPEEVALAGELASPSRRRRREAAESIPCRFWPGDSPNPHTVQVMLDALADPDRGVRAAAAGTLAKARLAAPEIMHALCQMMQDPSTRVRLASADALGRRWESPDAAITVLIAALDERRVRASAATALGRIGSAARRAVGRLIGCLGDRREDTLRAAIEALGRIGPDSAPAVRQISQELNNLPVRDVAARALGGIGPAARDAVPRLVRLLDGPHCEAASEGLAGIGPDAAAAVPALEEALVAGRARYEVPRALGRIGEAALETLVRLLDSPDPDTRSGAVDALGHMGAKAIPTLMWALEHPADGVRVRASVQMGCLGTEAVGPLSKALGHADARVRRSAAQALGKVGRPALEALPRLRELAGSDSDEGVRRAACRALGAIEPGLRTEGG